MSLDLINVSYTYNLGTSFEKKALQEVSLSIPEGSFVGIAGASGSGKTTLVRLIKGLIKPTSGEIKGYDNSDIGLVFQYPEAQLFESTVLKDVMFGPLNQAQTQEAAQKKAIEALSLLQLDESFYKRDPLALSGGEKRRVAIAGILAMEPSLLILDEPTAGLDGALHNQLFSVLHSLNEAGKTIILVSHNMDDLAEHCSQVAIMKAGRLLAFGSPKTVFYEENLSEEQLPSVVRIAKKLNLDGICTLRALEVALFQ